MQDYSSTPPRSNSGARAIEKIALFLFVGIVALLLFIGLLFAGEYNSMVTSRNTTDKAWSRVETQYQRRYDLIGNLVESVKGAQGQELAVFSAIAQARSNYANANGTSAKAAAASQIETNVALVPRLQEAYPDLKSNTQVTQLMNELTGTEGAVLAARNDYNDQANTYNTGIQRFPRAVFAGIFGFQPKTLFKSNPAAAQAPQVKFSK
jgi:LemA protein